MNPSRVSLRLALALVRAWTRVYTTGLPQALRERRVTEIESDVWEHCHHSIDSAADSLAIVGRLVRGIPDDLGWRVACFNADVPVRRWAVATVLTIAILTSSIWIVVATRTLPLPTPPAPPDLVIRRTSYPPPPPPPPPPCNPPGIGRAPFTPCTPY
jgi:hypothetical protein